MVQRYKNKTGQSEESLIEMLDAETWLTPEEAVELGFADKVDYSEEQVGSLHSSLITKITAMFKTKSQIVEALLTSDEIKDLALGLDVSAKLELIKALADNVEGVEEVCVKLGEGEEKYMSSPEVAVIPMEGHAMLIALGVLEERTAEAMEEEEEEVLSEEHEEEEEVAAMTEEEEELEAEEEEEEEVPASKKKYKSQVKTLLAAVTELKSQIEEIKEERAAMKVHTPDNKASKVDWKELAIQNALNNK
jgi:predicted RNase H-like nuclease (RuvC/YqgF family)